MSRTPTDLWTERQKSVPTWKITVMALCSRKLLFMGILQSFFSSTMYKEGVRLQCVHTACANEAQ